MNILCCWFKRGPNPRVATMVSNEPEIIENRSFEIATNCDVPFYLPPPLDATPCRYFE